MCFLAEPLEQKLKYFRAPPKRYSDNAPSSFKLLNLECVRTFDLVTVVVQKPRLLSFGESTNNLVLTNKETVTRRQRRTRTMRMFDSMIIDEGVTKV
jgi:hypothetical protein